MHTSLHPPAAIKRIRFLDRLISQRCALNTSNPTRRSISPPSSMTVREHVRSALPMLGGRRRRGAGRGRRVWHSQRNRKVAVSKAEASHIHAPMGFPQCSKIDYVGGFFETTLDRNRGFTKSFSWFERCLNEAIWPYKKRFRMWIKIKQNRMCMCVFIKLYITAPPGPPILILSMLLVGWMLLMRDHYSFNAACWMDSPYEGSVVATVVMAAPMKRRDKRDGTPPLYALF